jgi:hypothetical protein
MSVVEHFEWGHYTAQKNVPALEDAKKMTPKQLAKTHHDLHFDPDGRQVFLHSTVIRERSLHRHVLGE